MSKLSLEPSYRAVWLSRHGGPTTPYDLTPEQRAGRAGTEMEESQRLMEREAQIAVQAFLSTFPDGEPLYWRSIRIGQLENALEMALEKMRQVRFENTDEQFRWEASMLKIESYAKERA